MQKNNHFDQVIAILPHLELNNKITLKEIRLIVFHHLHLTPMFASLREILIWKGLV